MRLLFSGFIGSIFLVLLIDPSIPAKLVWECADYACRSDRKSYYGLVSIVGIIGMFFVLLPFLIIGWNKGVAMWTPVVKFLMQHFNALLSSSRIRKESNIRHRQYTELLRAKELHEAGVFTTSEYEAEVAKIKVA
jgi:hypothetical protein